MVEFVSEKEVDATAIPALQDWIEKSGILSVLKKRGVREYVVLLTGSAGHGYALKKKSDTDLVLIYEKYGQKYSTDDNKRRYTRLQEYIRQNNTTAFEEEKNQFISTLKKECEKAPSSSAEPGRVCLAIHDSLGMADRAFHVLHYDPRGSISQTCAGTNKKLSALGLKFGDLFIEPLWGNTLIGALKSCTYPASHIGDVHESLPPPGLIFDVTQCAHNLFLLRHGKAVFSSHNDTQEKFCLFLTLILKMCSLCEFARSQIRFDKAIAEVKKLARSGDPEKVNQARAIAELPIYKCVRRRWGGNASLKDVIDRELRG